MATINGTSSNDTLSGTSGDDTLNGFEGNDLFLAGSTGGTDVINGGAGRDSIEFKTRATSAIVVDFVAGTITGGSSGTISFTSIERILTGDFNDTLIGNAAGQTLTGQGGSDTISGAGGIDTLWGGTAADSFVFRETGTANADRISDFASGSDKIVLDATVMSALGASGNFAASDARFVANSAGTAQDASDRIIYETDTRQIWYDADGNGATATRQLIATLQVGATLVATDIVVQGGSGGGSGTIVGTEGDDSLTGTSGNDTIDGRGGNDTIDGRAGDDSLVGGTGNDLITGGAGRDGLIGGAGNDTLQGWFNNLHPELLAWPDGTDQPDTMDGGLGNDHYYVDNPADVMSDAGGVDTVHVWERSWTLADAFENLELHGDRSDVTGVGNALGNFMRLVFNGGRLEGRDGDDTLVATDRGAELFGEGGNDSLVGDFMNDTLDGGAGDDTFRGGTSDDTLSGGAGADVFILDDRSHWDDGFGRPSFDTILDFASGVDDIVLDARVMRELGASGTLMPDDPRFYAAPGATEGHDADDRLVYDTGTGRLYYDSDGLGVADAEVIFVLNAGAGAAALAATDISVINGTSGTPREEIVGTSGNDTLVGTEGRDHIDGLGGNDSIDALAGNDIVVGGLGQDTLQGGVGDDALVGGDGEFSDLLAGGEGADRLTGGGGADQFVVDEVIDESDFPDIGDSVTDFAPGSDELLLDLGAMPALGSPGRFAPGDDRFHSAPGARDGADSDDRIVYDTTTGEVYYDQDGSGSGGSRLVVTLEGAPSLTAADFVVMGTPPQPSEADDQLFGTTGNDTIDGLGGDDTIDGLAGDDLLFGSEGGDFLFGRDGADQLHGGAENDWLEGGAGNDTLTGGSGFDLLFGDADDDLLDDRSDGVPAPFTQGGATFAGGAGNDTIFGGAANDEIQLDNDYGVDAIDGGGGRDFIAFFWRLAPSAAVVANLENGTVSGGGSGSATVTNVEDVYGTTLDDDLVGDAQANLLSGSPWGPSSFDGNDSLDGRAGNDVLVGGTGADRYAFTVSPGLSNADEVVGFSTGSGDWIVLDGTVHANSGPSGRFASDDARFAANSTGAAQDASDRVIYNTSTGQLWYDADGAGGSAAQLIATLQGAPTLSANFIEVVNGTAPGNVINGTAANDTLTGTAGDDTIDGMAGNDVLRGLEGADSLRGGAGNDTLWGFWELSEFESDFAADTLEGGLGDDEYNVNDDGDLILADPGGIDTVVAWNADWTLDAGLENLELESLIGDGTGNELGNRIAGAYEGGMLLGLGGSDTLIARGSENGTRLDGGAGVDTLVGATGVDAYLFTVAPGAANADEIAAFDSGDDRIMLDGAVHASSGPSGTFAAGDARFWSSGTGAAHDADDRVIYHTGTGELWYDADGNGAGTRQLIATVQGAPTVAATDIEVINGSAGGQLVNGTSGNDTLTGTAGDDTINGLGGNDLFVAGSTGGNDVIDGGAGRDSIEFKERATSAITVDFGAGTITGGSSGAISFANIERILTGNFNDTLTGNGASQTLTGQGGADTIWGAGGTDTLWGGTGADAFVFREMGAANADRVSDFASGSDKLHLDDAAFSAIGAMGNFAASDARFKANSSGTATDTNDRVVFNTSTGQLYYDADGSGSGAAALIATVQAGASVASADIVVI